MYFLGVHLTEGLWPAGRVAEVLRGGCPRCGTAFDRAAGVEPDGAIKMICAGCSTAYWTAPGEGSDAR